jgi:integrase
MPRLRPRSVSHPDRVIHDIRHSFASQLVTKGVPLKVIQELLGHSTIQMTERYAHLAPSATRNAIRVLLSEGPEQRPAEKPEQGLVPFLVPFLFRGL